MLREIGSNFWLVPNETYRDLPLAPPMQFGCEGKDFLWLSTGRSAIAMVLDEIGRAHPSASKIALLPAFTCETVIEPFLQKGYRVDVYDIDRNLHASVKDIHDKAVHLGVSVVLIHRYFGFDTLSGDASEIQAFSQDGIVTIEDCTQCLYSDVERWPVDYYVASIRKWCGVPDGGFAVSRESFFANHPETSDVALEKAKCEAAFAKYEYMFHDVGCKENFLRMYREAESLLDSRTEYYAISSISAKIQSNLNRQEMAHARRQNYQFLTSALEHSDILSFPLGKLNDKIVPLYCPILTGQRDKLQRCLASEAVYAPIVWPKAENCPLVDEHTQYVYDHLLCIPIDQRYGQEEMEKIATILKKQDD